MTSRHLLALALSGCAAEPLAEEPTCDGLGPVALEVGSGGAAGFTPWADGDAVPLTQQGEYGFQVELSTTGLDTTAPLTAFVRFSLGEETTTEDVGATLTLQCAEDAVGWVGVFAGLDDADQAAAGAGDLDGEALHLSVTVADQAEDTATRELELTLAGP